MTFPLYRTGFIDPFLEVIRDGEGRLENRLEPRNSAGSLLTETAFIVENPLWMEGFER